jgi:hypothetical protein
VLVVDGKRFAKLASDAQKGAFKSVGKEDFFIVSKAKFDCLGDFFVWVVCHVWVIVGDCGGH